MSQRGDSGTLIFVSRKRFVKCGVCGGKFDAEACFPPISSAIFCQLCLHQCAIFNFIYQQLTLYKLNVTALLYKAQITK